MLRDIFHKTAKSGKEHLTKTAAAIIGLSLIGLSGCSDDSIVDQAPAAGSPQAQIRVIHASPDSPKVGVSLSGVIAASNLDYGQSTNYASVDAGTYDISVLGVVPSAGFVTGFEEVISVPGTALAENSKTTIIAIDPYTSIKPWVVADSEATPAADEVALKVVHAATAAAVDIYVVATEELVTAATLAGETPAISNLTYESSVDVGVITAEKVEIIATNIGAQNVLYNSGPIDLTDFGGQKLLLAAIDTTSTTAAAASAIKILVAADGAWLTLYDADTQAGARIVHAAPNANAVAMGGVDVFATVSKLNADPAAELVDNIDYLETVPSTSMHTEIAPATYLFHVAPNSGTIDDSVYPPKDDDGNEIKIEVPVMTAKEYTIIAKGRLGENEDNSLDFDLLVTEDQPRGIATQASVRVIHAAPSAGNVNVFVTPAGAYSAAEVEDGMAGDPMLSGFAFSAITNYIPLVAGDYDVRVVADGSVAINVETLTLTAGSVSTIIAHGPSEPDGAPTDFGTLLLTD